MITEKILIVDDEETVCQSVKKILTKKGYHVDKALSADEAVNKINQQKFDLVITDLMMPKTSGIDLIKIIKENYPELKVIMITGYASIESAVKATKLGVSGYIPKPFTPEELLKATIETLAKEKMIVQKQNQDESNIQDENIDVDLPFNERELTEATSKEFVEALTHSDIPLAKKITTQAYCNLGKRNCRRLVLEDRECIGECPLEKKAKERTKKTNVSYSQDIIDVDMPFNPSELEKYTSVDFISCLTRSDIPLAGLIGKNKETRHKALIVDDEPIVCHSVRKILTKHDIMVIESFDVDVALQKLKLENFDIVILDLKMPKMTGIELLKIINENWPSIPVILMSGYATIENAIEAIKTGATDVIPKPFTPDELLRKTQEILTS